MKKRIIIILFISVWIGIGLFLYIKEYINNNIVNEIDNCEILVATSEFADVVDDTYEEFVIKPLSLDNCAELGEDEKENCVNNYWLQINILQHNLKDCVTINDLSMRDECVYAIAQKHILELNSEKICDRIVERTKRINCKTIIARFRPYTMKNTICSDVYINEPYEKKICEDRNLAMQIRYIINDSKNISEMIEGAMMCNSEMALEYGTLCFKYALEAMKYDCESLADGELKDYCVTYSINKQAKRTNLDCEAIPLENYRKVCLREIEEQKDMFEMDSDGDGKDDGGELFYNLDPFDPDTDGDGLSDGDEISKFFSSPANFDTDGDGLSDGEELRSDTDFHNPDTDGDGIKDGSDEAPLDNLQDSDGDRLSDLDEEKWGTDPSNRDTDGDGASDGAEILVLGTNPLGEGWNHDTDGDGLIDVDEIFYLTDRLEPDTDGDGATDGEEILSLRNPNGEGDLDFDGDGLSDKEEEEIGTNPSKTDTDEDGYTDKDELGAGYDPLY